MTDHAATLAALAARATALADEMPDYDEGVQTPDSPETRDLVKRAKAIETEIKTAHAAVHDDEALDWREANAATSETSSAAWRLRSRRLGLQTAPLPVASWRDLPARMLDRDEPTIHGPYETDRYAAGDLVAIYSRGGVREAIVVSTGKTRIEVAYTTATAVREAIEHNRNATITRKTVPTTDVFNHRPAPRASISEEENMAGKPDPKPTPSKAPSKSKTKSATSTPRKRSQAASKPEATPETTPEPTPETETTPESQPEPIVELPSRDAAPADLATSVVEYVEEATEATIERVPTPSGGEERFRVDGKTVAYVAVGKRGVSVKVGLQSGKRERITVKTSDDVAAAGRSLVETLDLLARQTAEAQEEAVAS